MVKSRTPGRAPAPSSSEFLLPRELRERYYELGYWRQEDLWMSFEAIAAVDRGATAYIDGERQISFGELQRQAVEFGKALRQRGLEPGDVVVIHGRHCIESVVAIMGCAWAGLLAALLPHLFSAEQIRSILFVTGCRMIVALGEPAEVDRAIAAATRESASAVVVGADGQARDGILTWSALISSASATVALRRPVHADAPMLMTFSSGTTGEPKGVVHSSNTIRFAVESYTRYQAIGRADTSLVVTAFGFIGSSVLGSYLSFLSGCRTVLLRSWSADATLALIERHGVSHILLMPTHAIDLLDSPALMHANCSSLARGVVAGLGEARREEARRRLCALPFPMYGMSESPGHVTGTLSDPWERIRTTEGRPLPGTDLLICDDEDNAVPAGDHGHILVRGPNRFLGYFGAEELNRTSLTGNGYFRTGDIGFVDPDGYLTFVTRSKDIIRRGGVTITPAEVEEALRPHPRIADVAVIGLPDPRLGERACACVISRDGNDISLAELCVYLERRGFAPYLWPERVVVLESFPRTPSLKVQKHELRKCVLAGGTS